jgi:hypothetical protein
LFIIKSTINVSEKGNRKMETDYKKDLQEAIDFIKEETGEDPRRDLGLTDDQIMHMVEEGF